MAPEVIERYSEQLVFVYVLLLGIAATVTGFKDIFTLTVASLRNAPTNSSSNSAGEARDAEKRPPSD